jgi:MYXO-CTERM domain-containing protein
MARSPARFLGFVAFPLAACVAGALAACGDASSRDPLARTESPITNSPTFANDQTAFDYFLAKGLANFQAAGIVGNLDQESGMDPNAVQQNGPGRGTAQWSVGGRWDTDANDNVLSYASQQGKSEWSLQLQLDFIWYELTTFPGYGLADLQQSADVSSATIAFQDKFEICGACNSSQRIAYAQMALAMFGNDMVDGGSSSGSSSSSSGGSSSGSGSGSSGGSSGSSSGSHGGSSSGSSGGSSGVSSSSGSSGAGTAGPDGGGQADMNWGGSSGGRGCDVSASPTPSAFGLSALSLIGLAWVRKRRVESRRLRS